MREAIVDTRANARSAEIFIPGPEGRSAVQPVLDLAPAGAVLRGRAGTLRLPAGEGPDTVTRLVVPVPDAGLDEAGLGRLLWEITGATDRGILLVGKVAGADSEMLIRRRLTTLAALLRRRRGDQIETVVVFARTWLEALRHVCAQGDAVVCPGEDSTMNRTHPERTVAHRVFSELHLPVYLLEGLPQSLLDAPRAGAGIVLAWVAPLVVLIAFGGIQGEIVTQTQGWLQTSLLAATVLLELATLLAVQPLAP